MEPVAPGVKTPIILRDNPSKDFYYPLDEDSLLEIVEKLPEDISEKLSYIWLRRPHIKNSEEYIPNGYFVTGSDVRMIILDAWPKSNQTYVGKGKIEKKILRSYSKWSNATKKNGNYYSIQWDHESTLKFYSFLFLQNIGYLEDWYQRLWSRANGKKSESFSVSYARIWGEEVNEKILD